MRLGNNKPKFGEVWVALEGTKSRPVLIYNNGIAIDIDLGVARITTQKNDDSFDVEIKRWRDANLNKPSYVRCSKLSNMPDYKFDYKIGEIHPDDLRIVREKIKAFVDKDFEKELERYARK